MSRKKSLSCSACRLLAHQQGHMEKPLRQSVWHEPLLCHQFHRCQLGDWPALYYSGSLLRYSAGRGHGVADLDRPAHARLKSPTPDSSRSFHRLRRMGSPLQHDRGLFAAACSRPGPFRWRRSGPHARVPAGTDSHRRILYGSDGLHAPASAGSGTDPTCWSTREESYRQSATVCRRRFCSPKNWHPSVSSWAAPHMNSIIPSPPCWAIPTCCSAPRSRPNSSHWPAKIGQYVRRTKSLVASLISFARQAPSPRAPIDLNTLARTAVKLTQPQWETLEIEVRTQFDPASAQSFGGFQSVASGMPATGCELPARAQRARRPRAHR